MLTSVPSNAAGYDDLRALALRRINADWDLTRAEREVLTRIAEASYGCRQRMACIPNQAQLALACGLDRSRVCRAVKALREKGVIVRLEAEREVLYEINLDWKPEVPPADSAEASTAWAKIMAMQARREGGTADITGQLRLYGILGQREDAGIEVAMLRASAELDKVHAAHSGAVLQNSQHGGAIVNTGGLDATRTTPEPGRAVQHGGADVPSPGEIAAALAALRSKMSGAAPPGVAEKSTPVPIVQPVAECATPATPTTAPIINHNLLVTTNDSMRVAAGGQTLNWESVPRRYRPHTVGYSGHQKEVWEMLCREATTGSKEGLDEFMSYGKWWSDQVRKHANFVYEGIADHQLARARGDGSDKPGKVIHGTIIRLKQ